MTATLKLTSQQQAILSTTNISVAVSAGAGCGKTFVLTERFMGFLRARVGQPEPLFGIVAITFTNKAAREMRHRVRLACMRELEDAPAEQVPYWIAVMRGLDAARISTIHAFASTLLRRFSVEAGLDPAFGIPDSSLGATFIQRAVEAAFCELLEEGDPDAREMVLRFGLETAFARTGQLAPGLRTHADPDHFENLTPEQLWDAWKARWDEHCVPSLCESFAASPAKLMAARLLESHEPTHAKMIERRARLLELFAEPPTSDPGDWLLAIEKMATVQGGGAAKAWSDSSVYDSIKDAFTALRGAAKGIRQQLEAAGSPDYEAPAIALQAHRVTKRVLERLERRKRREALVEFDDLLVRTRNLLRDRPEIARRAARGLELLMVDEFQDTDPIQAEIVRLLCGDGLTSGRLFLVGDAKQSIYRFRGADPGVFSELRHELPRRGHLPLSMNFRSQPAILNFVNYTFESEIPDYEALRPSNPQASPEPAIEFLFSQPEEKGSASENRRREARWIAGRISQLLEDETPRVRDENAGGLRRVLPGDIAILFRALTSVHLYEQALSRNALPYYLVKSRAFFAQQEIHDVAHLCRWLEDPSDELSLAGVLRSPLFGLTDDTLLALKPDKRRSLAEGLARPPRLAEGQAEQVRRAHRILTELRSVKDCFSLADLLNLAIDRTGYDAALLAEHLGARKLANLRKLIELARSFAETGPVTLTDFARRLQDAVREETAEEAAATHPEVGDVLRLMTIHQAKGLEFPVVILADMEWKNSGGGSDAVHHPVLGPIFPIPESGPTIESDDGESDAPRGKKHLGELIQAAAERAQEEAEQTRLLYVALTRPRDHLILSACLDVSGKLKSPWMKLLARRFDLATGLPPVDPYFGAIAGTARTPETLPRVHVHHQEPLAAKPDDRQGAARSSLKNFRETVSRAAPEPLPELVSPVERDPARRRMFTATELTEIDCELRAGSSANNGTDCAIDDREERLLTARETSLDASTLPDTRTVGNLVHHALEHVDFANTETGDEAALNRLIERSLTSLHAGGDRTLAEAATRRVAMVLNSPLRGTLAAAKRLHRELPFRMIWPSTDADNPVQIVGVIDGLYQDDAGQWHLFDYKITEQANKPDTALVERYELQLLIYALATERALGIRPTSAELIRLEEDARSISIDINDGRLHDAGGRIDYAISVARGSA